MLPFVWHCQVKVNGSENLLDQYNSGCELAPFGQGGRTVELEVVSTAKVSFDVEEVVDGGMDGGEFL